MRKSSGNLLKLAGDPTPWPAFETSYQVIARQGLQSCLKTVKEWIETCDSHLDCTSAAITKLPKRVLDLHPHRFRNAISLVETEEEDVGIYMTLSHRWGRVQPMTTTKDTLPRRKTAIRLPDLPRTFQDTVAVCRGLGVQYLWIDSLCILQGDKLDWEQESAKMAAIYTNSYLNIAATRANDSTGGCFPDRWIAIDIRGSTQAIPLKSYEIRENHAGRPVSTHVRVSLEAGHDDFLHSIRSVEGRAPLLSRAWVFQERCLARRTLHFHAHELVWECKMGLMCECKGLNAVEKDKNWYNRGWKALHTKWKAADLQNMADLWLEVVNVFSTLDLTHESDRLPALSGIASRFAGPVLSDYLAGLWREDLARSLLWFIGPHWKSSSRRPWPLRAPTWSWASVLLNKQVDAVLTPFITLGPVQLFCQDVNFRILDAQCSSSIVNPFGEVRGGTLTVECLFNSVTLIKESSKGSNTLLILDRDIVEEDDLVLISQEIMHPDIALTKANSDEVFGPVMVHCLFVGSKSNGSESNVERAVEYALVVCASTSFEDAYERIGLLATHSIDQADYQNWFHASSVGIFQIH